MECISKLRAVLPDHDLLKLYQQMLLCREFEEACAEQYTKGNITGFLHLYSGQEAVGVGASKALQKNDYVVSLPRTCPGAGAGSGPKRVWPNCSQVYGDVQREGGIDALFDPELAFMGGYAMSAASFPLPSGLAFLRNIVKRRSSPLLFGDGAVTGNFTRV